MAEDKKKALTAVRKKMEQRRREAAMALAGQVEATMTEQRWANGIEELSRLQSSIAAIDAVIAETPGSYTLENIS